LKQGAMGGKLIGAGGGGFLMFYCKNGESTRSLKRFEKWFEMGTFPFRL